MIAADYIVVGSGITGAAIARVLADAGREVLVLERRSQSGGNVIDAVHEASGIRYGLHGPHYFRTNSDRIWEFANRFGGFWPYEARIQTLIDGKLEKWPVQREFIRRIAGDDWLPRFTGKPHNFEESCLSIMPWQVYEKAAKPYTEKMWGCSASALSVSLCHRFDVRDGEDRLTPHAKHQGVPRNGYTAWMQQMLNGIPVQLGFDYLKRRKDVQARRQLVFTGPIDEFFGFRLGRLNYRAQKRNHFYLPTTESLYPVAQVNNPQHEIGPHIRTIEWKHLMPCRGQTIGTLLTSETPYSPMDSDCYEYPFPDGRNAKLYMEYRRLTQQERVVFAGRLGRFQYLDMDAAIASALQVAQNLL